MASLTNCTFVDIPVPCNAKPVRKVRRVGVFVITNNYLGSPEMELIRSKIEVIEEIKLGDGKFDYTRILAESDKFPELKEGEELQEIPEYQVLIETEPGVNGKAVLKDFRFVKACICGGNCKCGRV